VGKETALAALMRPRTLDIRMTYRLLSSRRGWLLKWMRSDLRDASASPTEYAAALTLVPTLLASL
jgi:hypothetical protein